MAPLRTLILAAVLGIALNTMSLHAETAAPRGEADSAAARTQALLDRAEQRVRDKGEQAMATFSQAGEFQDGDLYVFVVGLDDEVVYAHGGSPRQVGRKAGELVDAKGKYFIREMIALAKSKGEGDVHYAWRNPANLKVENKHSYIVRVGKYLVGAGAYTGPVR